MLDRYDENTILAYIEGELDAKARVELETRLAHDEPARLLIEQLVADRQMLQAVPAEEAPPHVMMGVNEALHQQMLVGAVSETSTEASIGIPHPDQNSQSPRTLRFPVWRSWLRYSSAAAAALLIAGGLLWHFDPLGWQKTQNTLPPIAVKTSTSDDAVKKQDESFWTRIENSKRGENEQLALGNSRDTAGERFDGQTRTKVDGEALDTLGGGKGAAALAMAAEARKAADFAEGDNEAAEHMKRLRQQVGNALEFQIELQTASASTTREALLAWAKANDAAEPQTLSARRASFGNATAKSRGEEQTERDIEAEKKKADTKPAAKADSTGRAEGPGEGGEKRAPNEKSPPAPAAPATPAVAPTTPGPAPTADPGTQTPGKGGIPGPQPTGPRNDAKDAASHDHLAKDERSDAAGAAPAVLAEAAIPADGKDRNTAERAKSSVVRHEITLLVPADKVDALVQHIEAKTGQSLVITRDSDQALLLSPQVANQRAVKKAEQAAKQVRMRAADGQLSRGIDGKGGAGNAPAIGADSARHNDDGQPGATRGHNEPNRAATTADVKTSPAKAADAYGETKREKYAEKSAEKDSHDKAPPLGKADAPPPPAPAPGNVATTPAPAAAPGAAQGATTQPAKPQAAALKEKQLTENATADRDAAPRVVVKIIILEEAPQE